MALHRLLCRSNHPFANTKKSPYNCGTKTINTSAEFSIQLTYMLKKILPLFLFAGLFSSCLVAQIPNYMPAVNRAYMNFRFNSFMMNNMINHFNYQGVSFGNHFFVVELNDSTIIKVFGTIRPDSSIQYLQWKDKTVKRNDTGRIKKIYPYQTKEITRIDQNSPQLTGFSTDTCWLFKAISGKITCYSPVADDDLMKDFIFYIQKNNGPLIKMTPDNLESMLSGNEKALNLFGKKKYERAIAVFNRTD